jgi:2-phosphosulfolactate phosphatase
VIDCFAEGAREYGADYAIVAIDVIRATTTALTGVALGRQCYPVPSLEAARRLAGMLANPLLAGELEGDMPAGFEINNSPSELERRNDTARPMVLLSTSGTRLICSYGATRPVYVACLRNYSAQAAHLIHTHQKVALIGAGSRGEFRTEDILCCARLASCLLKAGYEPQDDRTRAAIDQWSEAPLSAIVSGKSARYLRQSGQESDLDFVLTHIDDLPGVYRFIRGQIIEVEGQ